MDVPGSPWVSPGFLLAQGPLHVVPKLIGSFMTTIVSIGADDRDLSPGNVLRPQQNWHDTSAARHNDSAQYERKCARETDGP